jgi:hypothetical protein
MNDELAKQMLAELISIRLLLEKQPTAAPSKLFGTVATDFKIEIPQPTELVDEPESVCVHFGKNKDVPLGNLGARSIEWYAQEPQPKVGTNGKPFTPRAVDIALRNAARQIVHSRRGTLHAKAKAVATHTPHSANNLSGEEEVPF